MPLSAGDKLGRSEIPSLLGQGRMGEVYYVGPDYLVMEYVEGHTLSGPLDGLAKALEPLYARKMNSFLPDNTEV